MSETSQPTVLAHPELGLIASPEMEEAFKAEIGTRPLDTEEYRNGKSIGKKEFLPDRDVREIAVAEINEKLAALEEANSTSTADIKARNDLRDIKNVLVDLPQSPELSFYGTASELAKELAEKGDTDRAEVTNAAAQMLQGIMNAPYNVDYSREDYQDQNKAITQDMIKQHNDRIHNLKMREQK